MVDNASPRVEIAEPLSSFFGLPSLNESFRKRGIKPVPILFHLFFKSSLDINLTREIVRERIVKQYFRFRSQASLDSKNHLFFVEKAIEDINLDFHVQEVASAGWTRQDIDSFSYEKYRIGRDSAFPLWNIYIFNKLENGRSCLLVDVDHAICDGSSLLEIIVSGLLDQSQSATPSKLDLSASQLQSSAPSTLPSPQSSSSSSSSASSLTWSDKIITYVNGCCEPFIPPKSDTPNTLKFRPPSGDDLSSQEKVFACAEPIPLVKLKAIQKKLPGVTINDILATVLNLCVHRYMRDKDDPALKSPHSLIRCCLPISTRDPNIPLKAVLGNYAGIDTFQLKFDYTSKTDLVREIKHRIDVIKYSPYLALAAFILTVVLNIAPLNVLLNIYKRRSVLYSISLSNVRGPAAGLTGPLFLSGHQLEDLYFVALGDMSAYFAAVSYHGSLRVSLAAVESVVPDPSALTVSWTQEFDALYKEVVEEGRSGENVNSNTSSSSAVSVFGVVSIFSVMLILIAVSAKYYYTIY